MRRDSVWLACVLMWTAAVASGMHLPPDFCAGAIRLASPGGIAFDGEGRGYVLCRRPADQGGGLYRLECPIGERLVAFSWPSAIVCHQGKVWVTEDIPGVLCRVDPKTWSKEVWVAGFNTPGWPDRDDDPTGLAIAPPGFRGPNVDPGDILVVDRGRTGKGAPWWIHTVNPRTRGKHRTLAANASDKYCGTLFDPIAIAVGVDGAVFVLECLRKPRVFELTSSGRLTPQAACPLLMCAQSIAVRPSTGELYVHDENSGFIVESEPFSKTADVFVADMPKRRRPHPGFIAMNSLAWSLDGETLYAGDAFAGRVYVITRRPESLPFRVVAPGVKADVRAIPFDALGGVAYDAKGTLYVGRRGSTKKGAGVYAVRDGEVGPRIWALPDMFELLFAADGSLYAAEMLNGNIWRMQKGGAPRLVVRGFTGFPGGDSDDDPAGLCIAPPGFQGPNVAPGNLLVIDSGMLRADRASNANWVYSVETTPPHRVRTVRADVDDAAPKPMGNPQDATTTPDGRVFIADRRGDGHIWELKPDGSVRELHTVDDKGELVFIHDLCAIACRPTTGMLYVVGAYLGEVFKVDPATGRAETFAVGLVGFEKTSRLSLAWSPDGRKLCVADPAGQVLYEITLAE